MANYHPSNDLLIEFSAGKLPNALGIMVASHIENCAECQKKTNIFASIGGELINDIHQTDVNEALFGNILSQLDKDPEIIIPRPSYKGIPRPLSRFMSGPLENIKWRGYARSLKEYNLPISDNQYNAKLYKISAGKKLPEHTHKGNEYTLVLSGKFSDNAGCYDIGDFIATDNAITHQPKAWTNSCLLYTSPSPRDRG